MGAVGPRENGTCTVVLTGERRCRGYATGGTDRCWAHMTPDERTDKRRREDEFWVQLMSMAPPRGLAWPHDDPACWLWPGEKLEEYMRKRCAICDWDDSLVQDHDHETGLVRGYLCRSCNIREGKACDLPIFTKYRRRNPYSMLGREFPYTGYGWVDGKPPVA